MLELFAGGQSVGEAGTLESLGRRFRQTKVRRHMKTGPRGARLTDVRTAAKVTRTKVTIDDLRARVRAFEEKNPGYNRANYLDLFRDKATGDLIESDEFLEVSRLYQRLARAAMHV